MSSIVISYIFGRDEVLGPYRLGIVVVDEKSRQRKGYRKLDQTFQADFNQLLFTESIAATARFHSGI